jgi:hypothetical protein
VGRGIRGLAPRAAASGLSAMALGGNRPLTPWAVASGLSAMALGGSRPPNAVGRGARVPTPM